MSLQIVPDSNALYGDPFFTGVTSRSILLSAQLVDIKLVVADLVQDELRNIVVKRARDVSHKMLRLASDAEKINLGITLEPSKWQIGYEISQVAKKFDAHMSQHQSIHGSIPYSSVSARELASRAVERTRPFQDNERGLRDSLLWLSLIESAKNNSDPYLLVTRDKIFWDDQGIGLHPQLIQELGAIGLQDRVRVRKSLAVVLDEFVKPYLIPSDAVRIAIEAGSIPDFTESSDAIDIAIFDYLLLEDIPEDWLLDTNHFSAELDVVEDVQLVQVVSAHEIQGEDTVLVTSEWSASINILVSRLGYFEDSETPLVTFTIATLVEPNKLEVQDHEVTDYELTGWWNRETETIIPF